MLVNYLHQPSNYSVGVTLRFIGITQDDVDKDFVELEI